MSLEMSAAQFDMFADAPVIPGFSQAGEFTSPDEEEQLIARIGGVELPPFRFQGWLGKRRTASFGWRYDFDDASFGPADPIPDWLLPLRDRAAAFAGLKADDLSQAAINLYEPGAGVGWHRDRPLYEHVVGVSLGAPTVMRFRQRSDGGFRRATVPLPPRSVYRLSDEARHAWEHSVPEQDATRWSIMFRNLSAKGLARLK
jgi:alkylated DNA repair protein (DNA oxidative demethylase)